MTILEQIAEYTKERIRQEQQIRSSEVIKVSALAMPKGDFGFEKALKKDGIAFICECKKASPSKGIIAEDFPYLDIAKEYERAGSDCISVLTEPKWFLGKDEYLTEIASNVDIPCIRKDFVINDYMIYQAKLLKASAVLLICALLSQKQLEDYIHVCDNLGLSALVEAHDKEEIQKAIGAGARIIGVNNRNLKDFSVDIDNSSRLRDSVPSDILFVAESGIKSYEDIKILKERGVNAVLIGEALMKAQDKKAKLNELKGLRE